MFTAGQDVRLWLPHFRATFPGAPLALSVDLARAKIQPDDSTKAISRKAGDYALASPDALLHVECRGEDGGTIILSMTAPDGILFEYFDENMENGWTLSIERYVDAWNKGTAYGATPQAGAA